MKKMTFLAIMVGVLVLAMAVPALAISPAYLTWDAAGNNAGTNGPHQNYTLTTEKCAVCHSVHAAAASNAAAGVFATDAISATQTEMLLRSSDADACTYCHITTNVAGLQIYNGVATNYTTDDSYGHNGSSHASCASCHAVHGADTFDGYIGGKILKAGNEVVGNASDEVQTEAAATLNLAVSSGTIFTAPAAADGDLQVTAFCTRCHKTFSDASETTITASGYFNDFNGNVTYGSQSYKNHPLKAFEGSFEASGATTTSQVAWADAETCRSCHAAGSTRRSTSYGGPGGVVAWSFPHHTPGNSNFLVAGTALNDANIGIDNTSLVKPAGSNVVDEAAADGVCLRCHDSGVAGAGVNDSF
ncbi:MAG: hypothetical protein PF636_06895 [Actinomycetota bacterium]|jgi:hypothetical protein|nr:hypothetical protein [Actinomycetota bacterium]